MQCSCVSYLAEEQLTRCFLSEECKKNIGIRGKSCKRVFVDIEKAFDRVQKKMMKWVMRKKGLPELILRAVISFYHGAKTKVRMGVELLEKFLLQVGVGYCISRICVFCTFCNYDGCNYGECTRRIYE